MRGEKNKTLWPENVPCVQTCKCIAVSWVIPHDNVKIFGCKFRTGCFLLLLPRFHSITGDAYWIHNNAGPPRFFGRGFPPENIHMWWCDEK
jgi:hypothetical protein